MASSSKETRSMKSLIEQFCSITGASDDVGKRMLEACDGNLEMAINMHVDATEAPNTSQELSELVAAAADSCASGETRDNTEVRAPIPPTQGILVEEGFSFGFRGGRRRPPRSVFDGFRDFEAETRRQEQELWNPGDSQSRQRQKTLEDLFRPPVDLMHKGTFDTAREQGQLDNKWLMVNVQNVQEFSCQMLNRDVWSNQAVKSIIREHFVFYQVYHDSDEGQRYMQFYKVHDWPYVAIIDPRTGENMVVWSRVDPVTFCDLVTEFLTAHPSLDGTLPSSPPKKRQKIDSIVDASEDSQLEAAIRASLIETSAKEQERKKCDSKEDGEEEESDIETFDSDSEVSSMLGKASTSSETTQDPDISRCKPNNDASNDIEDSVSSSDATEWKQFLGDPKDGKSNLVLRFPDGRKQQLTLPASSKLKALVLFVDIEGFSSEKYELVTNFPRRQLSNLDSSITLKDAGLFPQETVFIQAR